MTGQHKCPVISVCCSVPGGQLFCNNGHAQHWTACSSAHSPPHSILLREEPLGSPDFNPLLPGPRTEVGEVYDLAPGIQGGGRKTSQNDYLGQLALCIKLCVSQTQHVNFWDWGREMLYQHLRHTDQFPTSSMLKSWLRGQTCTHRVRTASLRLSGITRD